MKTGSTINMHTSALNSLHTLTIPLYETTPKTFAVEERTFS